MTTNPIVTRYCEIVRGNDAVQTVLDAINGDDRYEIVWELCDTAIDCGHGGDPNDDYAIGRLFDRCAKLVDQVQAELS